MKETYRWQTTATQARLVAQLYEAKKLNFSCKVYNDKIRIRKTSIGLYSSLQPPILNYPRPFLFIKIKQSENGVILDGKIVPFPPYRIIILLCYLSFIILSWINSQDFFVSLTAAIGSGMLLSIPMILLKVFLPDYFERETKDVLNFLTNVCLDSMKEYTDSNITR